MVVEWSGGGSAITRREGEVGEAAIEVFSGGARIQTL